MTSIFDIFKKKPVKVKKEDQKEKKPVVKKKEEKAPVIKDEKKKVVKKAKKTVKKKVVNVKKSELIVKTLKSPHITEKATILAENSKYVFKVDKRANKINIKKAIEALYGVDVISVNIINMKPKKRRMGRIIGKKPAFKKAIVKIKKDQKIDVIS